MNIPILSNIYDSFNTVATWLKDQGKYWWGVFLGVVLVPINWACDQVLAIQGWLLEKLEHLSETAADMVAQLHVGAMWGAAGPWLAKANALVPIDFAVSVTLICMAVWVVCTIIRIVIHFIPVPTSG
jgi:hypothetical protein